MKKISKSLWTILFIIVISLLSAIPVFAENKDSEIMRDSYAYQDGVIYLEETETYRIAFTVHHDGRVTYSVCYKNNSGVVYSGEYFIQNTRSAETFPEIVDILLSLEPTKVTDFTSRPVSKGTITSADKAVDFCASYAPGWRTPVDFEWLGTQSSGGITVIVYESVNGYGEEKVYLNYDVGTLIESLITLLDGFNIEAIIDIVTVGVNGTGDLVAQVGGIITHYRVDNTRTKIATISGDTYYWAGWDMIYDVLSGDKSTSVTVERDYAHPDYNNNISYFVQKAIDSYNS